jgi:hypothetical protein
MPPSVIDLRRSAVPLRNPAGPCPLLPRSPLVRFASGPSGSPVESVTFPHSRCCSDDEDEDDEEDD